MKFLLIEDRPERQKKHLSSQGLDLDDFSNLKNVAGGDEFIELKRHISKGEFSFLESFDGLFIHRSAINEIQFNSLFEYCKLNKKCLVLFSGGISSIHIQNSGRFWTLNIDSQTFYSHNLISFLEFTNKGEFILPMLAFGKKWKLNILLNSLRSLTIELSRQELPERIPANILCSKLKFLQSSIVTNLFDELNINIEWLNESMITSPKSLLVQLEREMKQTCETLSLNG